MERDQSMTRNYAVNVYRGSGGKNACLYNSISDEWTALFARIDMRMGGHNRRSGDSCAHKKYPISHSFTITLKVMI
jgi:hypothetical protein